MMRPEERVLPKLIGRPLHKNIGVQFQQGELCVLRVNWNSRFDVAVNDDEDLHSLLSLPLEQPVQSPFLADCGRSSHVKLGTQPPIMNINYVPCLVNST